MVATHAGRTFGGGGDPLLFEHAAEQVAHVVNVNCVSIPRAEARVSKGEERGRGSSGAVAAMDGGGKRKSQLPPDVKSLQPPKFCGVLSQPDVRGELQGCRP